MYVFCFFFSAMVRWYSDWSYEQGRGDMRSRTRSHLSNLPDNGDKEREKMDPDLRPDTRHDVS